MRLAAQRRREAKKFAGFFDRLVGEAADGGPPEDSPDGGDQSGSAEQSLPREEAEIGRDWPRLAEIGRDCAR